MNQSKIIMNKEIESFIKTGMEDFKAAEVLSKYLLFPQSIYFIQQSIEKVLKGMLLSNDIVNTSDFTKKIRHDVSVIFNNEQNNLNLKNQKSTLTIEKKVSTLFLKIEEFKKNHEVIDHYVDELFSIARISDLLKNKKSGLSYEQQCLLVDSEPMQKYLTLRISIYKPKSINYFLAIKNLLIFNEVFAKDISIYRYPDSLTHIAPHERFNKQNEVSKSLRKIIFELNIIFATISEYFFSKSEILTLPEIPKFNI